jgi:hypothetical protein
MKKLAWLLAALAAIMLLLAACSGGDDDDDSDSGDDDDNSTPAALTENDLAEAMLLVLDDLPQGWSASGPDTDDDEPNPLDECDTGDSPGLIGKAESEDFTQDPGGLSEVSQDIRIFDNEESLVSDLDDFDEIADCIGARVEEGVLDDESATFGDFKFGEIDYREFGDQSHTYRISMVVSATDPDAEPPTVDFFIDMVFVAIDNVGMKISAIDIFDPYDPTEVAAVVEAGEAKVRDVLANGPGETAAPGDTFQPSVTSADVTAPPDTSGTAGTFEDPIPFGQGGTFLDAVSVKVLDVNPDAADVILAENAFNDTPAPGNRMVLIRLEFTNVGSEPYDVYADPRFNLVGDKAVVYDEFDGYCGVTPDPLEGEIFPGGTKAGDICLQVDGTDSNLVFFLAQFDDNFDEQRLFFALK